MVGSKQPTPVWLTPEEADAVRKVFITRNYVLIFFLALHSWCIRLEIRQC